MTKKKGTLLASIGALGIVYGDIGTSPLYAMRAVLLPLSLNTIDVLGAMSLVFWSLIVVISLKYLTLIFKADNDGEGGVLALLALLRQHAAQYQAYLYVFGIFGAGLMLGDGMLTPAISVLSAVEGLSLLSPQFTSFVIPVACVILIGLFMLQYQGTDRVGKYFGPILLVWFITIGVLGLREVWEFPTILKAIDPRYACSFFYRNGLKGFWLLGEVFLVVTGGEALYADLGHFGKRPIRLSWFVIALPCLLLNYFGQSAHLLHAPESIENPFYHLAPQAFFIPLVILSTMATVIASQAVISATFSLTKQAVLLGFYPRLPIVQTSAHNPGHVYIPQINAFLLSGTMLLIFIFQTSGNLAHAYGIAVNLTMLMVTLLVGCTALWVWRWPIWKIVLIISPFVCVDLSFFVANAHKLLTGAVVPVGFAMLVAMVMLSWNQGIQYLKRAHYMTRADIGNLIKKFGYARMRRMPRKTAVFLTDVYDKSGGSFLKFLKLTNTVPEHVVIVSYSVKNKPHIAWAQRIECFDLGYNIHKLHISYGFMDNIVLPKALQYVNDLKVLPFALHEEKISYFVEIPNVIALKEKRTLRFFWQEKLFAFMLRNYSSNLNISFYHLPFDRTIALGSYFDI